MKSVKVSVASDSNDGAVSPKYSLHPYQRQVLRDILRALNSNANDRRAVAHLPTGAGKTRVAVHAACHLLNESDADGSLVIWLAAAEELCEQAAEQLSIGWKHLGLRGAHVHRYWGAQPLDLRDLPSGFLVTGLAKLRSAALQDHTLLAHLAGRAAAVIFDEAHQAVAETYLFVTEQLCSARPPLLGLTATPGRTANLTDADHRLAKMFNHCKVSIDPRGHDSPVTYLIQNRFLAEPRFRPITFESKAPITHTQPGVDYGADALASMGRNLRRTREIVELARNAAKRHFRTIVFCPSVECAVECAKLLKAVGVASAAITANTPSEERRAIVAAFKDDRGGHMALFNYGVLTTGFDAPRTRCVIIARPTTSLVLYSQMAGRAMRGPRAGGNRHADIFTVVDTNLPGFGSVTDAFTNWEELWSNNQT